MRYKYLKKTYDAQKAQNALPSIKTRYKTPKCMHDKIKHMFFIFSSLSKLMRSIL